MNTILMLSMAMSFCFFSFNAIAQKDTYCTKGLTYGEFLQMSKIRDVNVLEDALQKKCFERVSVNLFTYYERVYERSDEYNVYEFNDVISVNNGLLYQYKCSELAVCHKLLHQVNDNAIYYCRSDDDPDTYYYILNDGQHVIENRDIKDENIGYAYGFRYRNVTKADLDRLRGAKQTDAFPRSAAERAKLEYRYERIGSENNVVTVRINAGDRIFMEAGGEISLGAFAGKTGPDGIDGYTIYKRVSSFKHGSLLYHIGDGAWACLDENKTFTAVTSGKLEFIVNDNDPSNNSGQFWVNIKIIRK